MKILGNIVLTLMLLHVSVNASMKAHVDATEVTQGDSVTLDLTLMGKDIEKPQLRELCGEKITSTSQMQSSQYINGSVTSQTTFSYMFTPTKSCVIKPISLNIDGKTETSQSIQIKVSKMKITKNSDYILELKSSKKEVYVGEPFEIDLYFKQKRNASGVDSKFQPPNFKNFWIKKQDQNQKYFENAYVVTKLVYIVSPQKVGDFTIEPANMKIATRTNSSNAWGQWLPSVKWHSYFSNELALQVKPLPANADLVGDFHLEVSVDKKSVEANEPLNVTYKIIGNGNFEDIGDLKPSIKGVSIYAEDPKVNEFFDKGKYVGAFSQKMAIVADANYTIPAFDLAYFNTKTSRVEHLSSDAIDVVVKGSNLVKQAQKPTIERAENSTPKTITVVKKGIDIFSAIGIFVGGILLGVLLSLIPFRRWFKKDTTPLHVNAKDKKEVLMFLMKHKEDKDVSAMIERLEAVLYKGSSEMIDTKEIKLMIKALQDS